MPAFTSWAIAPLMQAAVGPPARLLHRPWWVRVGSVAPRAELSCRGEHSASP